MAKQPTNPPPGPKPPAPPAPPRKRSAHAELPAGILEQTIKLTRLASCPVCNGRLTSEKSDGARETCVRCEQSDTSHPKPACSLCGGSGQVRNAPLHRYNPCPKCFSFAAMLADVDAKTHVSTSSLWGAPQRTTPTPFDAITPETLEGVTLTRADTAPIGTGASVIPSLRDAKTMTFNQQIEGVPLSLVQQGFRRQPPESEWFEWQLEGPHGARWQPAPNFKAQRFCRPVALIEGVEVYAHQGWGDGLAPTPEMVRVWPFWWLKLTTGLFPARVSINEEDGVQCLFALGERVEDIQGTWAGPVLPPPEITT